MYQDFLKSYCKINLFLDVGYKNKKKKLHNIQSLVNILNLYDEIKIKKISKANDIIKFSGPFYRHVKKANNSVLKSIFLLRKKKIIKDNFHYLIKVKKNIPAFSGLGGGSSNAATIIKYFFKKTKISEKNLNYFSNSLGSDFKLFFKSSKILQLNLRVIKNIKSNLKFYFIIIYPFLKSSTKDIYSKVSHYSKFNNNNFNSNSKIKIIKQLKLRENALEKIVLKKYPKIKKILVELEKINNCEFSRLTGSGSACFGLFLSKRSAKSGLKKIKKKFPKYWCVIGKTI